MISVDDKDVVIAVACQDFWNLRRRVAVKNAEESVHGTEITRVVKDTIMVHVVSVYRVEQLAWEWIALVVGDVVKGQSDNVVGTNSVGTKDGVGVADVSLMAVVLVPIGSSDDDDVGVAAGKSCQDEEERKCKHVG